MKIDVLTLFPEMFEPLKSSILGRALEKDLYQLNLINIRDFSLDKHKKVDDYVFGGGDGMLMTPQPLYDAIMSVKTDDSYVIYMSPKGSMLKQNKVRNIAENFNHLIIVCGHYEGIDQRVIDLCVDEQISIGDYVLTGGEIPAMVLVDAVARYIPNVLGSDTSAEDESFSDGYLEYPQYTRPREFMGLSVPDVLLSGNHKEIEKWKQEKKLEETKKFRPDLLQK
jgi:tRNA (guanine37-N1)-methyltransferase